MTSRDALAVLESRQVDYSICSLVTDFVEYEGMRRSFERHGFVAPRCEFLHIDNSRTNRCDGYSGLNTFLRAAKGRYVVICHQDVELISDGIDELDARLHQLDALHPDWGLVGNAGGKHMADMHDMAMRISDPHVKDAARGPFPHRVTAIDENFMLAKASANLAVSGTLRGFHLYGTDLAIVASVLGYGVYVIDFHLLHKSPGKVRTGADLRPGELSFHDIKAAIAEKYRKAFAPRWVSTTTTEIFLAPQLFSDLSYNLREIAKDRIRRTPRLQRLFRL